MRQENQETPEYFLDLRDNLEDYLEIKRFFY